MTDHPLPVGARVRHYGQQWPAARAGTATICEAVGPLRDGSYEYRVTAGEDVSRRTGPDNPETREAWWSSDVTIPADEDPS
ncbi:hypothetical protein [Streptomyces himalayensis]|uniref:Uncharacterized protein n=1 Tax=Streptomyces himalayensis subsp. himalayensis TaxID=2756131 RepID=A0A7W0DUN4_9ACTN|nr:hypothetical protein [Streptomyces himalayensis]MBA2951626.1 hypothetical protein [Streptomyces himalayensis subsp. himalayensis]